MEEIRNILKCGGGAFGGVHPVGICVFSRCGFDTCSCFLVFPNSRLSGCCGFGLGLLSPRRLPGGGHLRLLGRFRDWLSSGFWIGIGRWCGGGLDNVPPSDDVIPLLAKVHLLGREPVPLSFCSGGVACDDVLSDTLGCLPCHTLEGWEPPHWTQHRGAYLQLCCVCPKRWQLLHCRGPFGAMYVSTDTRSSQSSVIERTLNTSGSSATNTVKWG